MDTWVDRIINTLQTGRKGDHFAHLKTLPERPAVYGDLDRPLPGKLQRVLEDRGISRLYSHQAEAINHLAGGDNVIVSTSTASGKSLCYHLPSLATILARRTARVLYMFPTKALAHDQLASIGELVPPGEAIACNAYDGDTPSRIGEASGATPTSSSPTRTCCTPRFCRSTAGGRSSCGTSSSW